IRDRKEETAFAAALMPFETVLRIRAMALMTTVRAAFHLCRNQLTIAARPLLTVALAPSMPPRTVDLMAFQADETSLRTIAHALLQLPWRIAMPAATIGTSALTTVLTLLRIQSQTMPIWAPTFCISGMKTLESQLANWEMIADKDWIAGITQFMIVPAM